MLIDYWRFARAHSRFLGFGFVLAFLSSPGQTYVIGVYGPHIQALFSLDNGEWGRIYMIGTLLSAALITWTGTLIDRVDLRIFTSLSLLGLVCACIAIGSVTTPIMLVLAIFLLRQFGQGLTSHAGITSMARYHDNNRGKAIALAAMGFALGEALLPSLALFTIQMWGWRESYYGTAIVVLLMIPVVLWLLKGHGVRHHRMLEALSSQQQNSGESAGYNRRQVLSEKRFYYLVPAIVAPSLIMTAMFFFPAEIAKAKGWDKLWVTGNYWTYSLAAVITVISSGSLIDRLTARRVVPLFLLPLALALISLSVSDHEFIIWSYMAFMGVSSGFYFTGLSALWAELYGAKFLGEIKSLVGAVMVFSSALGPALVGSLLTQGYSFEEICLILAVFCLFATFMLYFALKNKTASVY